MLFASPIFLFLFLPITLACYYILPKRLNNLFLLAASLFFYGWGDIENVVLFILLIVMNYVFGRLIQHYRKLSYALAIAAVFLNVGCLVIYKYLLFFIHIINAMSVRIHAPPLSAPSFILPLGISFITFRAISYLMDVYRKKVPAEKNIFTFSLYMSFFPHIIAGPIVRYTDLREQFTKRQHTVPMFSDGVQRFVTGLGKKVLIANNIGRVTDAIFQLTPDQLTPGLVWLAMISYMLQIYYDFSGYSDMAIGLARMFGFEFKENFNYPYISRSIKEFWQRWHITLSSWFRDYVYIPLGGSRQSALKTCATILFVFLLTGFWHGARFNFIAWGLYFGVFLIIEKVMSRFFDNLWRPLQHVYTLSVIFFGWLLFRVDSLHQTVLFLKLMFPFMSTHSLLGSVGPFITYKYTVVFIIAVIGCMPVLPAIHSWIHEQKQTAVSSVFTHLYNSISLMALTIILIYAIAQLAGDTYSPFIYFRF